MAAFHEVSFPLEVALGASGGPERLTDIVTLGSGREERNSRWADSRRRYDAGSGVRSFAALSSVLSFFEERRGRLYGFRFRDRIDQSSAGPGVPRTLTDQALGVGDGANRAFQLTNTYGPGPSAYRRVIAKPVAGTVRVAVAGIETNAFTLDVTTGGVTLNVAPPSGAIITAGFLFDVPVRFDTDRLTANWTSFAAGEIPAIPLIEIKV
ncbi:MAG: DUF2460 domain-containing protein [Alphaproteobacteria bacterium]